MEKSPFGMRARRLARAEAQALIGQVEALEAELKSVSFKLNRQIRLLDTTVEDYGFKIKMLGRDKSSYAEQMTARYQEEIAKNKQSRKQLEEVADKVRVLLQENNILKNDLANPGTDLEKVRAEVARIRDSLRQIGNIPEG